MRLVLSLARIWDRKVSSSSSVVGIIIANLAIKSEEAQITYHVYFRESIPQL